MSVIDGSKLPVGQAMNDHDPELCHVEPNCPDCARVYAEREAAKKPRRCGGCGRPWSEHKTGEVDACLLLAMRAGKPPVIR